MIVNDSESARAFGEQLCTAWWPRFKVWVINHVDDPVLTLEAAFMDGVRATLCLLQTLDEGVLVRLIGDEPCEAPTASLPQVDPSLEKKSKRPRARSNYGQPYR